MTSLTRLCLPESSFQAGETRSLLAERHSGCNTLCGRLGKKRRSGKIEGQTANAVTCKALKASCSPTLGWPGNSGRSARGVELCTGSFYFFSFNFYWGIVDLQCCQFHMYSKLNLLYIYIYIRVDTHIHPFLHSFPMQAITKYWVEFLVLHSRSFQLPISYSRVYVSIPVL